MSAINSGPAWDEVELGDVVTLHRGYDLPSSQRRSGTIPIVSSSGITGYHDEAKISPPGVVTGRYGTLGEVFFIEEPFWPLNTTLYVSDFHGNDARFVSYFLQCQSIATQGGASAVPGVNRNVLHRMPARRPPLGTQRKIAAVLSAYDELIENNSRRIELLEEMGKRLYREWFIDFRYPGHKNVPLVDSNLGLVPRGWTTGCIGDHATIVRGRSYRGVDIADESGVPFINLKCIARDGGFRAEGIKRYTGEFRDAQKVHAGDIVIAVTDMTQERRIVARAARVPNLGEEFGIFSMDLVKVIPKDLPSEYLLGLLMYSDFPDRVKGYANGANVLHLHPDRVADYRSSFPPPAIASLYADHLDPMYCLADELHAANGRLQAARDLLLPRLVSGEIDVTDIDITVPLVAA